MEGQKQLNELKKAYLDVFTGSSGKKVLAHLEGICFVNKTAYPKDAQALTLAFHEGMRFVVVHIKNMMNMDLETLIKLTEGE